MLKHSPASKEKLSNFLLLSTTKGQEFLDTKSKETTDVSKSSSEGFFPTDNSSSISTSIPEREAGTPTKVVKSSNLELDQMTNTTLSRGVSIDLETYQIETKERSKLNLNIKIPSASPELLVAGPSPNDVIIDPLEHVVLKPNDQFPLPAGQSSDSKDETLLTLSKTAYDQDNSTKDQRLYVETAPTSTGLKVSDAAPTFTRHNTFPQSSNDLLYSRNSVLTTTTDRSILAKFNDIDTIKIPDRYQKAELSHGTKEKRYSNTDLSINTNGKTNHRSSKTSFINAKKKSDALYHIPESKERQKLSERDYVKVYDLVTGIRSSVSRCSKAPPVINDEHFNQVSKLIFDREGNSQAPPTKYEFKFKDYAPEVFRDLRSMFGISQVEYLLSFQDEVGIRPYGSSGKSGSCFYYSNDQKFIIKTVHHAEHLHLRKILKEYYHYVKDNPNTFLCQFYGLHRLKVPTATGPEKVHMLVMNNIFPPHKKMHRTYDLKGSTLGRKTNITSSYGKDLNFLEEKESIYLSRDKKIQFEAQLRKDIALLKRLHVMDYSLLVGIHEVSQAFQDEQAFGLPLVPHIEEHYQRNSILDTNGGLRATDEANNPMDTVYYLGIIDCLTNYSTRKRLETFFRSLKYNRSIISAVPPDEYGSRFLKFIFDSIRVPNEEPTEVQKKRGFQKLKTKIKKSLKQE